MNTLGSVADIDHILPTTAGLICAQDRDAFLGHLTYLNIAQNQ